MPQQDEPMPSGREWKAVANLLHAADGLVWRWRTERGAVEACSAAFEDGLHRLALALGDLPGTLRERAGLDPQP